MAYDVERLRRTILHSEYEQAQTIREDCKLKGMNLTMGFAIAYKAGILDGKERQKEQIKTAYRRVATAEARISELEAALGIAVAASRTFEPYATDKEPIPGEEDREDEINE